MTGCLDSFDDGRVSTHEVYTVARLEQRNEAGDPYASFLPPAIPVSDDDDEAVLRAVVFVRETTEKVGQEFIGPLLVVSGAEYATMSFETLHERICDALRGRRPRLVAEMIGSDGEAELMFDDGSVQPVRPQG